MCGQLMLRVGCCCLQVLSPVDGTCLRVLGTPSTHSQVFFLFDCSDGPQEDVGVLGLPTSVALGGEGSVFVTDRRNHRVQVLLPHGDWKVVPTFTALERPWGLAVDANGDVIVSENSGKGVRVVSGWIDGEGPQEG